MILNVSSSSFRCLKSCSLKEDSLVCFLSSVGSEFQSLVGFQ